MATRENKRTLHVSDKHAHDRSEDEVLKQRRDERERHAEHGEKQVGDAQIQQQDVRQRPHPTILRDRQRDERVSAHRQNEDGDVQTDAQLHLYSSRASNWKSSVTSVTYRLVLRARRVDDICHFL